MRQHGFASLTRLVSLPEDTGGKFEITEEIKMSGFALGTNPLFAFPLSIRAIDDRKEKIYNN